MRYCVALVVVLVAWPSLVSAQDQNLPAEAAAAAMKLPEGFQATLFAAEPDVVQPIAMTFDDRGRLWVVECVSFPDWETGGKPGSDRVTIFTDTDGDGRHDKRTVFWDRGANLTGIALGFGGVWLCATPNLIFLPDRNGDDVPDGPPEVLLDGWDLRAKHNVFNGLTWGPDGWLYGMNGILSNSLIGPPGTPEKERTQFNCGVWRIHPVSRKFEVFAWGTTNPWGLDFDQYGQMFITNCVIHHLFHVVPGGHYDRMYGQDLNPHVYELLHSCADYIHWAGGPWQGSRGGQGDHDIAGGGHAHVGAMVYQADNWPEKFRGGLFTVNLHGRRVNHDGLDRAGSGYQARREADPIFSADPWFRGLELKYGPDGGVYLTDWNDTGECHDYVNTHKADGRIFKVTYGKTRPAPVNLAALGDADLVKLHLHPNQWHVRHARRILQERAAAGKLAPETLDDLRRLWQEADSVPTQLDAIWTLHATGGLDEAARRKLLDDPSEYVRGWAVRLEWEDRTASEATFARMLKLAGDDPSPLVRLELAAALQRMPDAQRMPLALALVAHEEDSSDQNLPLMLWYGIEPLAAADSQQAVKLIAAARIPLVRTLIARRLAAKQP